MPLLTSLLTFFIIATSSGLNWFEHTTLIDTASDLLNPPATSIVAVPHYQNKYALTASLAE